MNIPKSIDFHLDPKYYPKKEERFRNFQIIINVLKTQGNFKKRKDLDATLAMVAQEWLK